MAAESGTKSVDLANGTMPGITSPSVVPIAEGDGPAPVELTRDASKHMDNLLRATLIVDPCSFEFVQAVTVLQRRNDAKASVGGFSNPTDEAIRFRANPRLSFPASEIQELEVDGSGQARMMINFMGLTGTSGVLPHPYSELVLERAAAGDHTLAAFLDIFNHRAISLFYRAWQKSKLPVAYATPKDDFFSQYLLDLVGLGTTGLRDRQEIDDEALLHYVSLLAMQSRSATALEQILADYFDVPIEVQEFTGSWYGLDASTQCEMTDIESASRNLGGGAVVGDSIWDRQGRVRIRVGPLSMARYNDFLPQGKSNLALQAITRFFSNQCIDFEVQLVLESSQVPPVELDFDSKNPARLGWVSWARTAAIDYRDSVLRAQSNIDKAEADVEQIRLDCEGASTLHSDGRDNRQSLAEMKSAYDIAVKTLQQRRALMRMLSTDPDETILAI